VGGLAATILLYAEDLEGLGHVNRCLVVARQVLARREHVTAVLVTGSRVPDMFVLPPRCDFIKLPDRRPWTGSGQSEEENKAARLRLRGAGQLSRRYGRLRARILAEVLMELRPDVVVVDSDPHGSEGELHDGLVALKAKHPTSRLIYHMLDMIGDPARVRDRWRRDAVYETLDTLYDDVAVSGSPAICNVEDAYGLPQTVRPKVQYLGYVVREAPGTDEKAVRRRLGLRPSSRVVVVCVGGGHAGYPLLEVSLQALALVRREIPDLEAVVVAGPLQSAERLAALQALAHHGQRILRQEDTYELMSAADAIVAMSGYSTTAEALSLARPLVLAPKRPSGRMREQVTRADALAARGLARCISPESLTPGALADALSWALACDRVAYERRAREAGLTFDGADRLARLIDAHLPEA
jgi:predicted glycosyltransferase